MSANPLMNRPPPGDPLQRLHDHVAMLNDLRWVQASGKLYFVNKRLRTDSTYEHFVDRMAGQE